MVDNKKNQKKSTAVKKEKSIKKKPQQRKPQIKYKPAKITLKNRKKYIAVFLIREQNSYSVLKSKKFNPEAKTIRFKKGSSHQIDASNPTYSRGLKMFYFIDINEGQLTFNGEERENEINPELLDMIIEQNIIRQITSNFGEKMFGGQIINLIVALLFGVTIGFLIAGFVFGGFTV